MESGIWFLFKNYPRIVSEGFRMATGGPRIPKLRADPDGEKKAEERREHHRKWSETLRASGIPEVTADLKSGHRAPPVKTIHLQWYGAEYDVWHDTSIYIDLEKIRVYQCESWMLGRGHTGSGAMGVALFSAPFLLLGLPYIWSKNKLHDSREKKAGMSRHAIALMKELEGCLGSDDESLLREALKNEWLWEQKMHREVSFEEACDLLDACDMVEVVRPTDKISPKLHGYYWFDDAGDHIGDGNMEDGKHSRVSVLRSEFEGEEAKELTKHFKTRRKK